MNRRFNLEVYYSTDLEVDAAVCRTIYLLNSISKTSKAERTYTGLEPAVFANIMSRSLG